jgi:hypothetical protein
MRTKRWPRIGAAVLCTSLLVMLAVTHFPVYVTIAAGRYSVVCGCDEMGFRDFRSLSAYFIGVESAYSIDVEDCYPDHGLLQWWEILPEHGESVFGFYFMQANTTVPSALVLTVTLALWFRVWRRRVRAGHCRCCGYDLTGNVSGVCPECGNGVPPEFRSRRFSGADASLSETR